MSFTKLSISLSALVAALGATALPSPRSNYAVKERHAVPRAWTAVGDADKNSLLSLQIGIKQSNEGEVERHLLEVSDPSHARYGAHLSAKEIAEIVRPHKDSVSMVHEWLVEHGIKDFDYAPAQDWVTIIVPIEKAEELLQTKYSKFEHIDVVQPTTSFFTPTAELKGWGPVRGTEDNWNDWHPIEWWGNHGKHMYGPKPCVSVKTAAAGPLSEIQCTDILAASGCRSLSTNCCSLQCLVCDTDG
jgi:tripeptidyl-peptidase-1